MSEDWECLTVALSLIFPLLVFTPYSLTYSSTFDLSQHPRDAKAFAKRYELADVHIWILENTTPEDVFLASPGLSIFVPAALGRKVVCMPEIHSNPYVPYEPRRIARDKMFNALRSGSKDELIKLSKELSVSYLLWATSENNSCCKVTEADVLEYPVVFSKGDIRIHRLPNSVDG